MTGQTLLLEAEHVQLQINDRVRHQCPESLTDVYKKIGQVGAMLTLGPVGLILFTCILHVPILPVVGLIGLLWLVRVMEEPLTRMAMRLLWPPHRLWLRMRRPDALSAHTIRNIKVARKRTRLGVDVERGHLLLSGGGERWDLLRAHAVEVERAIDQGPELRLRLFKHGRTPVVVGAAPTEGALERMQEDFERLPRKEGEVILMSWKDFVRFVVDLRQIYKATGQRLPAPLDALGS